MANAAQYERTLLATNVFIMRVCIGAEQLSQFYLVYFHFFNRLVTTGKITYLRMESNKTKFSEFRSKKSGKKYDQKHVKWSLRVRQ